MVANWTITTVHSSDPSVVLPPCLDNVTPDVRSNLVALQSEPVYT